MDPVFTAPASGRSEGRRRVRAGAVFLRAILAAALLALPTSVAFGTASTLAAADPATCALRYLAAQQTADGVVSSPGVTEDVIFGAAAAGFDPSTLAATGGVSALGYLAAHAAATAGDTGATAKLSLAVIVSRLDPTSFGGQDLLAGLDGMYDTTTGAYGDGQTYPQSLAILALTAASVAGHPVPAGAVAFLKAAQDSDGSWNYLGVKDASAGADTNSTAIAIQALIAAGVPASDASVAAALAYLKGQQLADGGFPYSQAFGPPFSDPDSDAIVIQALVAAGENPAGAGWTNSGKTAVANILVFQDAATGGFAYPGNPGPDSFTTSQVPAGLEQVAFPGSRAWTRQAAIPSGLCASDAASPSPSASSSPSTGPAPSASVAPTATTTLAAVTPPVTSAIVGQSRGPAPDPMPFLLVVWATGASLVVVRLWTRRTSH